MVTKFSVTALLKWIAVLHRELLTAPLEYLNFSTELCKSKRLFKNSIQHNKMRYQAIVLEFMPAHKQG